jgi:type IV conjugative transfer system protein TraL
MTNIARYIDDPPQIFLWDIDDIILFSVISGAGILTGLITTCGIVGCGMVYILTKAKKDEVRGVLSSHDLLERLFRVERGPSELPRHTGDCWK